MVRLNSFFPSRYLNADDFPAPALVTIGRVEEELLNDGSSKPVVFFEELRKGLILNKTNGAKIATLIGSDETQDWAGQQIVLYRDVVQFQGKSTPCVRVQPPTPGVQAPEARPELPDEEVPF